jgi:hypothetical protein
LKSNDEPPYNSTELNDHLLERIDLIEKLRRQTLADSESSEDDLRRIRMLQVRQSIRIRGSNASFS